MDGHTDNKTEDVKNDIPDTGINNDGKEITEETNKAALENKKSEENPLAEVDLAHYLDIIDDFPLFVEEWGRVSKVFAGRLESLESKLSQIITNFKAMADFVNELSNDNSILDKKLTVIEKKLDHTSGTLSGVTSYIESNAQRTRRLEEGYDFHILKNFARQIIREITTLENMIDKTDDQEKKAIMQNSIDAMIELLERNSIIRIIPQEGSPYAGQEKFAECASEKIYNQAGDLNGRIAKVVRGGYQYEFNDGSIRVIAPAKVILFSTDKAQCVESSDITARLEDAAREKLKRMTIRERAKLIREEQDDSFLALAGKFFSSIPRETITMILTVVMLGISIFLTVVVCQQQRDIARLTGKPATVKNVKKPAPVNNGSSPKNLSRPKKISRQGDNAPKVTSGTGFDGSRESDYKVKGAESISKTENISHPSDVVIASDNIKNTSKEEKNPSAAACKSIKPDENITAKTENKAENADPKTNKPQAAQDKKVKTPDKKPEEKSTVQKPAETSKSDTAATSKNGKGSNGKSKEQVICR